MSKTPTMADSRDMIVVHDMFRREFTAIPGLVSEVAEGDHAHVATVAHHVEWMVTFLHAHHKGEDLLVWPKLLDRVPTTIDPLIYTMEAQHHGLAQALDDLGAKAVAWRTTSAGQDRDAVACAATQLLGRITEHLDLEEREVLPLIDTYLTQKEWAQVGGSGLKKMSFSQITVAFGMILHGATPQQVHIMRETLPRIPWTIFSLVGPRAYVKYARRLRSSQVVAHPTAASMTGS
jgi:hemerythrin-like domain-containing protein